MSRIFISYRREDSAGWTGRLTDRLKERFGPESIFIDIDTIEPGADFTEALRKAVGSCDVLLAMIGPRWVTAPTKPESRAFMIHRIGSEWKLSRHSHAKSV